MAARKLPVIKYTKDQTMPTVAADLSQAFGERQGLRLSISSHPVDIAPSGTEPNQISQTHPDRTSGLPTDGRGNPRRFRSDQ